MDVKTCPLQKFYKKSLALVSTCLPVLYALCLAKLYLWNMCRINYTYEDINDVFWPRREQILR